MNMSSYIQDVSNRKIIAQIPAQEWSETLLIGNGALGGAIYGGYHVERIDLSEVTFFSGRKESNYQVGAADAFARMRQAVRIGDYKKSVQESKAFIGVRKNYGTNLPVGQLHIEFHDIIDLQCTRYIQSLDIESGMVEITATYVSDDKNKNHEQSLAEPNESKHNIKREAFASNKDKALYYNINCDIMNSFRVYFSNEYMAYQTSAVDRQVYFEIQALETLHSNGATGVKLMGCINILQTDGQIQVNDKDITEMV